MSDGFKFELVVQSHFLNNQRILYFNDKFIFEGFEIKYCYDCFKALKYIKKCVNDINQNESILFHFLQKNHFAFDSMIFNRKLKILVMFQITINEEHHVFYEDLWKLINIKNNLKNYKDPKKKNKYERFFSYLCENKYVAIFGYQWLTPKEYENIKKGIENFEQKFKPENDKFILKPFMKELIEDIHQRKN